MKKLNYLFVLPVMVIASFALVACSGLTDQEKKFVGEWSSEYVSDTTYDTGSHVIWTAYDYMVYHEDKTYDDEWHSLIKVEYSFSDVSVRMYYYIHGNSKNSWSADNGIYVDSTMTISFQDEVAPGNVIAVKDKQTGKMRRFGVFNFPKEYDPEIVKTLQGIYQEMRQGLKESWDDMSKNKNVYKIMSLTDNQIIYEDNDGVKDTLNRGNSISPRIQQMMQEGNALKY